MVAVDGCFLGAVGVAVLMIGVAIYIGYPCPPLSSHLLQWKHNDASYFTIKNKKMFYKEVYGKGETAPSSTLLLLHGFPTSSYDWIKMWPELTKNFHRIIAVDFLGFGFSDKPVEYNYTIMEQADYVSSLLRALKVKDAHILSHDYGDSIAQELLARHNEGKSAFQIVSACLLNGGMFKETNFPRPVQRLMLGPLFIGRMLSRVSNSAMYSKGLSSVFGANKPSEEDMYDFWCGYCTKHGYLNSADILQYIEERGRHNIRWREALSNSQAPVHVIYGPADPVNPPAFVEFYRKVVPQGTIDVLDEEVGHYPQWEASGEVTRLYLKFVQRVLSQRA